MGGKPEIMDSARELANEITDTLVKDHAGEWITKAEIRNAWNIPWVKGAIVFSLLVEHGFEVEKMRVLVPLAAEQPSSSEES